MHRPAIFQIIAVDRGDDNMLEAHFGHGLRPTRRGSSSSSGAGLPVITLQNEQALVHVSPMIIMVACFLSQHSPIFGQPASSHTVTNPLDFTISRVSCIALGCRRFHADPFRLAQKRRIRAIPLFRMPVLGLYCRSKSPCQLNGAGTARNCKLTAGT